MDTSLSTTTTPSVTLPGGATIAPGQVNIGTQTTPNIINTSTASRATTNQSSAALQNALSMYNISSGQAPNTGNTTTGTPVLPNTTPTVNIDGTTSTAQSTTDPYLTSLNNISANSNASTKMLVDSIIASKNQQSAQVDKQYDAYKRGLQLLGIQHNEAQSSPDLLMSHINSAEDQHQQKLQTIQTETTKALATAQQAKENNDFKTLNAQMSYVKELNAQKVAELKAYQSSITTQPKIAADVAHNVYQTMQTLDPVDQQQFIQKVAQQYNLPLGALVTALTDEAGKQTITASKTATATTKAQSAGLLSPSEAKTLGVKYGTTISEAAKMGIVPQTKGKTATGGISKEQISAGEEKLNAAKGSDGYVDPALYKSAYDSWIKNGGTSAKFVSTYPPKDYINPSATTLPSYLMPAKAKASGRSS